MFFSDSHNVSGVSSGYKFRLLINNDSIMNNLSAIIQHPEVELLVDQT